MATVSLASDNSIPHGEGRPESYKSAPMCDYARPYDLAREVALHLYWKKWLRQHERSLQQDRIERTRSQFDASEDDLTCFN